jgi:hypothetical protein
MSKTLGSVAQVTSAVSTNSLLIEIDGSIRRIEISKLADIINSGGTMILSQIAWGVPIKQALQTSTYYGVIGNTAMYKEWKRRVGRYLINSSGEATKLHPNDSTLTAKGETTDETDKQVMVIGPSLYYVVKEDADTGGPVVWMSEYPIGGYRIGDCNGGLYFCYGAYLGNVQSNKLVSRSGLKPTGSTTITNFWTYAHNFGDGFGLCDWSWWTLIGLITLSEYGDTNIQAKLGYGRTGSGNSWSETQNTLTGLTVSLGDNTGTIAMTDVTSVTGACSVNLLGFEDFMGWYWQMTQGIYFGSSKVSGMTGTEAYIYQGNYIMPSEKIDGDTTNFYVTSAPKSDYRTITRCTSSGYPKYMVIGDHCDFLCSTIGGGTTSYWSDYYWANTTGQLCLVGGNASNGSSCGSFFVSSYSAFSYSHASCASRPAYYGDIKFVA